MPLLIDGMGPVLLAHRVPEYFGLKLRHLGFDQEQPGFDPGLERRTSQMMMVGDKNPLLGPQYSRNRMRGEKVALFVPAQSLKSLAFEGDFNEANGDLGRA